jgi:hypothetical protein
MRFFQPNGNPTIKVNWGWVTTIKMLLLSRVTISWNLYKGFVLMPSFSSRSDQWIIISFYYYSVLLSSFHLHMYICKAMRTESCSRTKTNFILLFVKRTTLLINNTQAMKASKVRKNKDMFLCFEICLLYLDWSLFCSYRELNGIREYSSSTIGLI